MLNCDLGVLTRFCVNDRCVCVIKTPNFLNQVYSQPTVVIVSLEPKMCTSGF